MFCMPSMKPMSSGSDMRPRYKRHLFPTLLLPILALILIVGFFTFRAANFSVPTHAAAPDTLVPLSGTLSPLLLQSHLLGATDPKQQLSLTIGLRPRNMSALANYAQDIAHPKSANYHRYLSSGQVDGIFAPTKVAQTSVLD